MTFIQAAHYRPGRLAPVRLIVLHDMESPESSTTAENVARYFARADSRVASAHYCIDSDSVVQCVREQDTAYGAKGANADGIHLEHAGYARQTPAEWVDPFGRAMLARSAALTADLCTRYGIPVRRLTPKQIHDGERGICGHGDVTAAYPPGTGHTDPGAGFPWPFYLDLVNAALHPLPEDDVSPADIEAVAQRVAELLRPTIKATEDRLHADHVVILRGTATGSHPNNLTSIGKAVGVKQ